MTIDNPNNVTKTRITLSKLMLMNGELKDYGKHIIRIGLFGNHELWAKVGGTGLSAIYELQGEA
jgi:hypothetical protein